MGERTGFNNVLTDGNQAVGTESRKACCAFRAGALCISTKGDVGRKLAEGQMRVAEIDDGCGRHAAVSLNQIDKRLRDVSFEPEYPP